MALTITIKGNRAYIDPRKLSATDSEVVKQIPNLKIVELTGSYMFPVTFILVRRLVKAFGKENINAIGQLDYWNELLDWEIRMPLALAARSAEELPNPPVERIASWRHQKQGFWFGYHLPVALLSEKVGAGKTKQFIDIICNRNLRKVIVSTTASAVDDWMVHARKHATRDYAVLVLGQKWKAKNANAKAEAIKQAFAENEYLIIVLSHDSIWRPPLGRIVGNRRGGMFDIGLLATLGFDCILVDEIHKLADPTGRLSLFLWRLGEHIKYRFGMTGTIIRHKPEQCFAAYRFLDSALLGDNYDLFCDRYCIFNRPSNKQIKAVQKTIDEGGAIPPGYENVDLRAADFGRRYIVNYRRLDELSNLMSAITFHVDDCNLDLPELIVQPQRCHMSLKGRRVYEELEQSCAVVLDDDTEILTPIKLTHLLRLAQCAGGALGERIIDPNTGELDFVKIHEIDESKESLLEEILRDIAPEEPVVVACRFRHELDVIARVSRRVGRKCYEQSGRRKQRLEWQAANGGEVLAGQIASVCEAIDLTRSHYLIPYSVGYSLFQYDQLIGRIDRPGQTRHPTVIPLISADTIDEAIYIAIEKHRDVAEVIYEYLKDLQRKYGNKKLPATSDMN